MSSKIYVIPFLAAISLTACSKSDETADTLTPEAKVGANSTNPVGASGDATATTEGNAGAIGATGRTGVATSDTATTGGPAATVGGGTTMTDTSRTSASGRRVNPSPSPTTGGNMGGGTGSGSTTGVAPGAGSTTGTSAGATR